MPKFVRTQNGILTYPALLEKEEIINRLRHNFVRDSFRRSELGKKSGNATGGTQCVEGKIADEQRRF